MNLNPTQELEVVQPTALEAISRAEVDISIATARKYSLHQAHQLPSVKQSMMSFATLDEETAKACFYTLPRGGKNIEGPSVRLAEIAVSCYGNLRVASRIVQTVASGDSPHVVVQAVVHDLERNIVVSIEKRRRITKKRNKDSIDEDDINLAANAGSAIAFRDAVFKVVPMALIKPVFEAARKVAVGDQKTLADRRAKCMETFAKMGIPADRVLHKLEKSSVEAVDLDDLQTLIGLFNAIKEGEVHIDEAFPPKKAAEVAGAPVPTAPAPAATVTAPVVQTEPAENDGDLGPATVTAASQAPSEAPITCRFCQQPVEDMASHNCQPMQDKAAELQKQSAAKEKPATETTPAAALPVAGTDAETANDALESVRFLAKESGVSEAAVLDFCKRNKLAKPDQVSISQLADSKLKNLCKTWPNIVGEIQKLNAAAQPPQA